jgi:predicted transcriptional regulator
MGFGLSLCWQLIIPKKFYRFTFNRKEKIDMSQTLLEMAKDLVTEQIRVHHLSPDDAKSLLLSTHSTLLSLHQREAPGLTITSPETGSEAAQVDWKRSITKHAVTCLECGNTFRQLSLRHLRVHDLDPNSYRTKYGIPSTQPLSSRDATARRREFAQQIRPWEQAALTRTLSQPGARTNGNPTRASKATL